MRLRGPDRRFVERLQRPPHLIDRHVEAALESEPHDIPVRVRALLRGDS
jgi:hypothetical protein